MYTTPPPSTYPSLPACPSSLFQVLLPGSRGIDAALMAHAQRISSRGYKVVIPELHDFFLSQTTQEAKAHYDSIASLNYSNEALMKVRIASLQKLLDNVEACVKHLKAPTSTYNIQKVFVVGFELGGAIASCLAVRPVLPATKRVAVDGVVSFFDPSLSLMDLRTPRSPQSFSVTSLIAPPYSAVPTIFLSPPQVPFCGHCGFRQQEPLAFEYRKSLGLDSKTHSSTLGPSANLHLYALFGADFHTEAHTSAPTAAENADVKKAWERTFSFLLE